MEAMTDLTELTARLRAYEGDQSDTTMCFNGLREEAAFIIESLAAAEKDVGVMVEQIKTCIAYASWRDHPPELANVCNAALGYVKLRAKVIHCDKCGDSYYDSGFSVGCPQCKIADLTGEIEADGGFKATIYRLHEIISQESDAAEKLRAENAELRAKLAAREKDAERFEWYFGSSDKLPFMKTYIDGVAAGYTVDQWRAAIDAAMRGDNE